MNGSITGVILWCIAFGILLIFGIFPIFIQILYVRLHIKKNNLTQKGTKIAKNMIVRLLFYALLSLLFEIPFFIAYLKNNKFEDIYWLGIISSLLFLSNRISKVGPVMINLVNERKWEIQYTNSVQNSSNQQYDIFVSYKKYTSDFVRLIVEQLIVAGYKVWFFEYEIKLNDWEKYQPTQWENLKPELSEVIKKSKFGLIFTNERYANSTYCLFELNELLNTDLYYQKVINIQTPGEITDLYRKYPKLSDCPSFESNNQKEIITFISEKIKQHIYFTPNEKPKANPNIFEGKCLGKTYKLDISEWQVVKQGGIPIEMDNMEGPVFCREIGDDKLELNIYYGEIFDQEAIRVSEDDERIYNKKIEFASQLYFKILEKESKITPIVHGVHFVIVNGYAQVALSYWIESYWSRKYSVILLNSELQATAEFVFTFGIFGSNRSYQQFCCYGYIMDNLVKSLKW